MTPEDISIIIEAQGAKTRQIVASLINDKLTEAGFTNIDVSIASREDSTGRLLDADQVPSLLDEMRASNPQMFERSVQLVALPHSHNPAEETRAQVTTLKDRLDLAEVEPPEYSEGFKALVRDITLNNGVPTDETMEMVRQEQESGTFVGAEA